MALDVFSRRFMDIDQVHKGALEVALEVKHTCISLGRPGGALYPGGPWGALEVAWEVSKHITPWRWPWKYNIRAWGTLEVHLWARGGRPAWQV